MATYAQLAADADRRVRRAAHDAQLVARHRDFDLSAQDQHAKSERAHFAVVGEGSATAQDNYRTNFERISWR